MSTVGTLIGAIGGLILSGYGLYKQEEEAERQRRYYGEELIEGRKRFGEEMGLRRAELSQRREEFAKQRADAQREAKRAWKFREEERDYQRTQDFVNNFRSVLREQPMFANNLRNIWRA